MQCLVWYNLPSQLGYQLSKCTQFGQYYVLYFSSVVSWDHKELTLVYDQSVQTSLNFSQYSVLKKG